MWIIDFIPAVVLHFLVLASIIGIVVTSLIPFIPEPHKTIVKVVCILVALFGLYIEGGLSEKQKWAARIAEQEAQIAKLQEESGKVTIQEVIKYVEKVKVVKEKGDVIIKEVKVYVPQAADDACTVNNGFVELHNYAVRNEVPPAPGATNEAASGVKLSTVSEVVVKNYNLYHQQSEQLIALQSWIREQQKLFNK
jgi:hypothetical protein